MSLLNLFTYVNISWITGHVSLSMWPYENLKSRSLSNPFLSTFFTFSSISNFSLTFRCKCNSTSLGHDRKKGTRCSSFNSPPHKFNFSKFLIKQTFPRNQGMYDSWLNGKLSSRLLFKYPPFASRSKVSDASLIKWSDPHKILYDLSKIKTQLKKDVWSYHKNIQMRSYLISNWPTFSRDGLNTTPQYFVLDE